MSLRAVGLWIKRVERRKGRGLPVSSGEDSASTAVGVGWVPAQGTKT